MANKKVTLLRRCKTPEGWRYYPIVVGKTGKVKPGVVLVGGLEVGCSTGYYVLRSFEGAKTVHTKVGDNAADAMAALHRARNLVGAKEFAVAAGAQIVEEDGRKNLRLEFGKFIQAAKDRGAMEAAEVYTLSVAEFLEVVGKTYADELVENDVTKYHKALRKRGLSERTIFNRHKNVVAFLLHLKLDTKTLAKVVPRYEKTVPQIFEPDELKTFFGSLTDPKHSLMFLLYLQTGVREREAMHLEWADLNPGAKTLKLKSKQRWKFQLKDFEQRELPVSDDLGERLAQYRKDYPDQAPLILGKSGKPDGHMLRLLKQLVRNAGLNCGVCEGCTGEHRECKRWYLHKFRATYCTKLLRSGMDIKTVQSMMGHSELASTMRYLRPAEGAGVQAAVNSIQWI